MRLHPRVIQPQFWSDGQLIRSLPPLGRLFYVGLWQAAEDSGCLYDSPFDLRIALFPSGEVTDDQIVEWLRVLCTLGKVVPYEAGGRRCLFLTNFHRHQKVKNARKPSVPLPPWVSFFPFPSNPDQGKYEVREFKTPVSYREDEDNKDPSSSFLSLGAQPNLTQKNLREEKHCAPPTGAPGEDPPYLPDESGDPEEAPEAEPTAPGAAAKRSSKPKAATHEIVEYYAAAYQARTGTPYPIAWAKESSLAKKLLSSQNADFVRRVIDFAFSEPCWAEDYLRGAASTFGGLCSQYGRFAALMQAPPRASPARARRGTEETPLDQLLRERGVDPWTSIGTSKSPGS